MLKISDVQGVVFDVDETLLDSGVADRATAIHEKARLQALREAAKKHDLPQLLTITPEENADGFLKSPVHSLEGAIWYLLFQHGVVASEALEPDHPLLLEIADRKNALTEVELRKSGKPITGAVEFVEWLAGSGLRDRMAVASTARRVEIDIFFNELTDLQRYFPEARIMAKDNVQHLKPHPEAFDKAFLSLGLPETARGNVLAFEDNPRGIMSAKAAGLYTCALTTVYSRQDLESLPVAPDLIADSYDEFKKLLSV